MWDMRIRAIAALMLTITSAGVALSCTTVEKQDAKPPAAVIREQTEPDKSETNGLKVLASGFHSGVTSAFVAVARDSETYRAFSALGASLPKLDEGFFKTNAVVAAFLGQRNTGGYSVEITRAPGGELRISERRPAKDAIVPMVITSPFRVIALPITENSPMRAELDSAWQQKELVYKVTGGQFTTSGGFAGRVERFRLTGQVRVMRLGNLASFLFSLEGASKRSHRSLIEMATGVVNNQAIIIQRLSAGSLIDPPHSPLKAEGAFDQDERKLSMKFTSLPSMVADGFAGEGGMEAITSGKRPKTEPGITSQK